MSESIPALIAELDIPSGFGDFSSAEDEADYWRHMCFRMRDALESLSAPSGDTERLGYYTDRRNGDLWHLSESGWSWVNGTSWSHVPKEHLVWTGEPNPFRRPSPVTREAPTSGVYIHGPLGEALRPALPEPAEVEWEYGRNVNTLHGPEIALTSREYAEFQRAPRGGPGPWVPVKGTEQ